jgi:hypothetical protein
MQVRRALRRNRILATGLLILMVAIAVATRAQSIYCTAYGNATATLASSFEQQLRN